MKKKKNSNSKIKNFINVVKYAYFGNKNDNNEYTDKTFSILSSLLLYIIGYSMLIFDLVLFTYGINYYVNVFDWNWENIIGAIVNILISCSILIIVFLIATLMICSAREQEKSKGDKSIIVFSAIVSFVALIVAVIALFK